MNDRPKPKERLFLLNRYKQLTVTQVIYIVLRTSIPLLSALHHGWQLNPLNLQQPETMFIVLSEIAIRKLIKGDNEQRPIP